MSYTGRCKPQPTELGVSTVRLTGADADDQVSDDLIHVGVAGWFFC
ncbi:hypothetical protein [Micromonospora sp. NPDC005324]